MKKTLLILSLFLLSGCASLAGPDQYFFSCDMATMADRTAPTTTTFSRGEVPAVVVSGWDYFGHQLRIEVWRQLPNGTFRLAGAPKRGQLQNKDAFCYWYGPQLPAGIYQARLFVDDQLVRQFQFSVLR